MLASAIAVLLLATGVGGGEPEESPGEAARAGRVVLRWQAVAGAAGYDLQVSSDPSFARRQVEVRIEVAGYRLGPPPEGRLYWRVRAVDRDGRAGAWSATKTVEPLVRAPVPVAEPEPPLLDVPVPLADAGPVGTGDAPDERPGDLPRPSSLEPPSGLTSAPDEPPEAASVASVLRDVRPGLLLGWRHNLLAVGSLSVAIDVTWRLPWLGAGWSGSLRVGWWGDRTDVTPSAWSAPPIRASADVIPITALAARSFGTRWARLYAGAGGGVDLVVVRVERRGALEASAALVAVGGAGRRLGPGELFVELQGGLGGVDGPLGKLRTGGLGLSLGYHLGR